ncbi:MAG: T9SS type A sorting domain-containing protein [Candidatus Symbiothrix sp.]|jgi:hypothetical protein|nr:T9SS type A sorting domain-containing protein [Candidatus Symbiothrix sp.]
MKKSLFILTLAALMMPNAVAQTTLNSNFTVSTTFTAANGPYIITANIAVNQGVTVTFEAGAEVKFNASRSITVNGSLIANGVTFTGNNGVTAGFWDGLYVSEEGDTKPSGNISLTNCTIEYAKNIYVKKGTLTLNGSTLNSFSASGVKIYKDGTANLHSSSISACNNYPVEYTGEGTLNSDGNLTIDNNTNPYIGVNIQNINNLLYLKNFGLPYYITRDIYVYGKLQVDAGTNIAVYRRIYINGQIEAIGTAENPITFENKSSATTWSGFRFEDAADDANCILRNCIIRGAINNGNEYAAINIFNASPTIDSCQIIDNLRNVYISGTSAPIFSNSVFGAAVTGYTSDYSINILMDVSASPVFTNDSILFNATQLRGISLVGATVTGDAQLPKRSFANIENITYILYGTLTIPVGASLTVEAGVVIKARNTSSVILANGILTGVGTTEQPIVFTSITDDNYGNPLDTQNDGVVSVTYRTDGQIRLYSSQQSILDHWYILSGGLSSNGYAVDVRNNNIVRNCEIGNAYRGVLFTQNAVVKDNSFSSVRDYPLGYTLDAGTPDIEDNLLYNVGFDGILLDGVASGSHTLSPMSLGGILQSPYILAKNITIAAGSVLTIESDNIFKINSAYTVFTVNGAIKAIGTKNRKIIFTSIKDDSQCNDTNNDGSTTIPDKGDAGLFVYNNTDSEDNILRNCEFLYGRTISITNSKVKIDSVRFNFITPYPLAIYGTANPEISNCVFNNIDDAPIYMDLFSNPTFAENSVANTRYIALRLRGGNLSGVVPIRNFAGYDNISYLCTENMTVNSSSELTIPAGAVFKGAFRWQIDGKINIEGSSEHPAVFTAIGDDSYGNPLDTEQNGNGSITTGSYFDFLDNSSDASAIDNAVFRYSQSYSVRLTGASPSISNSRFENINYAAVLLAGISAPSLTNNVFDNAKYALQTSITAYPSVESGNIIKGTTPRAIRITNETLAQDATLSKRNFAGIDDIPYLFDNYTVGTSARLTIDAGVICKFESGGYIDVKNGLTAIGGDSPDSVIVFTSYRDDFYGGDTYNDGDASQPAPGQWQYIRFSNEAIDADCQLKNCILRYGGYGINNGAIIIADASPTIENCRIYGYYYNGIYSSGVSFPSISRCDFTNSQGGSNCYAIKNATSANVITASDCWFGSETGPTHASNPAGTGEKVSDGVSFTPFATQIAKADLGDVSRNGTVNPYDASLVLQQAVGNITFDADQQLLADVNSSATVNSYDASLILQYSVGLITSFKTLPQLIAAHSKLQNANAEIVFGTITQNEASQIFVPLSLTIGNKIKSIDLQMTFDAEHLALAQIERNNLPTGISYAQNNDFSSGKINISIASPYDLSLQNNDILLIFNVINTSIASSELQINRFWANDNDLTDKQAVAIQTSVPTGFSATNIENGIHLLIENNTLNINADNSLVINNIQIFDLLGRKRFEQQGNERRIKLSPRLHTGIYIINIETDKGKITQNAVVK